MLKKYPGEIPTMAGPATYRIRVQGQLDLQRSERLGGMIITTSGGKNTKSISILEGELPDQAALSGVLNSLYELHMPVLSLECLDEQSSVDQRTNPNDDHNPKDR